MGNSLFADDAELLVDGCFDGRNAVKVMMIITKGETGGAQSHVLSLCSALRAQVEFAAAIGGTETVTPLGVGLAPFGIPVYELPSMRNTLSPIRVIAAVLSLMRLSREKRPDILHAHSAVAGVVARIAGAILRIPVIYTVHGFGFKPEVPRLQRWASWLAEFSLAPLTSRMICVSEYEGMLARRLPLAAGALRVIRNGIPDSEARAEPWLRPVRIAMVARLAPPKRADLFLEALAILRDQTGSEVRATLLGDGPERQALMALANKLSLSGVDFAGEVNDVPQRLARHGIFVLMSDHEGLPISVIEAMRSGLSIVASDLPGIRELLGDNERGLLVSNTANNLASTLARLLSSEELREDYGRSARQYFEANFTTDRTSVPVATLYRELAHASNS